MICELFLGATFRTSQSWRNGKLMLELTNAGSVCRVGSPHDDFYQSSLECLVELRSTKNHPGFFGTS